MLSPEERVVISVSDCHAMICRYRTLPYGTVSCECATNAEALEAAAIEALVAEGVPFEIGGHHPCPDQLAAQAEWQ